MEIVLRRSRAAILARGVSTHLTGRICLFKAKGYMGPVQVISTHSNTCRIQLHLQTDPWDGNHGSSQFSIDMPITGISATAFSVIVNAGYGINAIIISEDLVIKSIWALKSAGASTQMLLDAFNRGEGLPREVVELRYSPFVSSTIRG